MSIIDQIKKAKATVITPEKIAAMELRLKLADEKFASQNYHYVVVKKLIRGN